MRCTLAGLIPLMMSEKYSALTEGFYESQKEEFDKIIENKSYYLIRDLPVPIASRILLPEIPGILARQKSNGLWNNSTKVTHDILSALKHVGVLDDLVAGKKLKDVAEHVADKYDYDSLLVKSIYLQTDEKDVREINGLIKNIRDTQSENGSWDNTMVATVHHLEKLLSLGVSRDDPSVREGIDFLIAHLNFELKKPQNPSKTNEKQSGIDLLREDRDLEFEATKKYKKEMDPKLVCFRRFGTMQNAICLKFLVKTGLESDERVGATLDNIYSVYKNYNSLCYFNIRKKFIAGQKKSQTKTVDRFKIKSSG